MRFRTPVPAGPFVTGAGKDVGVSTPEKVPVTGVISTPKAGPEAKPQLVPETSMVPFPKLVRTVGISSWSLMTVPSASAGEVRVRLRAESMDPVNVTT